MEMRARATVFWPGMSDDIRSVRASCQDCNRNAPSQAATPPAPVSVPSTPFESVFGDYFDYRGQHYLVIGDRLSGWVEVFRAPSGTPQAGSAGLVACLRLLFATFGVPETLSSDGGPEFSASTTKDFLSRWGVNHRLSSAYFPQSNGRAEVAVKSAKRLLMSNTSSTGVLNNDNLLRALLQMRNTPDPDCHLSPAEILFGHPLRDAFSFVNRLEKYSNPAVSQTWRDAWKAKEDALRVRFTRTSESLSTHFRPLAPLKQGDRVFIQNQCGRFPKKWDKSGAVVESLPHDQYRVKVDGSGRLTLRNRRFLRQFTRATPLIDPGRFASPAQPYPDSSIPMPPATTTLTPPASPAHPSTASILEPTPALRHSDPPSLPPATNPVSEPSIEDTSPSATPLVPPAITSDGLPKSTLRDAPPARPQRSVHPKRIYEPETGHWVPI